MPFPLLAVPVGTWLMGLVTTAFTSFCTWLVSKMIYERAVAFALTTAFIFTAISLTLGISLSIKALIIGARITMPGSLGLATFFLPPNINTVFGIIVTVRVSRALYRWTIETFSAYVPTKYMGSKWAF